METQPIDVQTVDPPAEPSVLVSPKQSADDKRAAYQFKQKGVKPDETMDVSKQNEPVESESKPKQKQREDFTESDQEAGASCQNLWVHSKKVLRHCKICKFVWVSRF